METQVMYDSATNLGMPEHDDQTMHQLCVKVGTCIRLIVIAKILYVHAAGNYVGIVMVGGETVHTKEPISHIVERLPSYLFVRIHRSYLVNIEYIREIRSRQNNYEFTLSNDVRILSGTTYRKATRKRFSISLEDSGKSSKHLPTTDAEHLSMPPTGSQRELLSDIKTHIRICESGDEYALSLLGKIAFMETYAGVFRQEDILAHTINHDTPAIYRTWLKNKAARIWIAETEASNTPVGYIVLAPANIPSVDTRSDDLRIHRIYLLKSFRSNGLGMSLMTMALQHAKRVGCHRLLLRDTRENKSSVELYQHLGFNSIGTYPCQIGSREYDSTVFSLEID